MKNKVSVIIPAYNAEKYINNCLTSVCNQTYRNTEIIIIDDGSNDLTLEILNKFALIDKRIILMHKSNGGQSSARNLGLEKMTGNYFMFVDIDDEIKNDCVENLVESIEKYDADISTCGMIIKSKNKLLKKYCYENELFENDQIIKEFLTEKHAFGPTCKLYRTSIFGKIRYIEGTIFEDIEYLSKIYLKAKRIIMTNYESYIYNINRDSTTHSEFNEKKLDILRMTKIVEDRLKNSNISCKEELNYFLSFNYISFLLMCLDANKIKVYKNDCKKIVNWMKMNIKDLIKNNYISIKNKLYILSFVCTDEPYLLKIIRKFNR